MEQHERNITTKIKNGDESGLRMLFDLYYMPLCIYAYQFLDSYEKAEDVVQEAFIDLWEKDRMHDFSGSIKSYLFKVIRNNSIHEAKKDSRFRFEDVENKAYRIVEENYEMDDFEERKAKLYEEIDKLPKKSKKVFEAIVFEKMQYAKVAEELDISINTVKTHYQRALKQLRNNLDVLIVILMS